MKKYHDFLIERLKDPKQAAGYLNAVLEEQDEEMFLIALKEVAEAQGGMSKLSRVAKLNRPNLYRIFSKHGNPEICTISNILNVFGLRLSVATK